MNSLIKNDKHELRELLVRMERNNKTLEHLSSKINSYTCEPHDPFCFEKMYNLKRNFKVFVEHQNRIAKLINQKKEIAADLSEDIRLHLERFKELENDVAMYLLELKRHS